MTGRIVWVAELVRTRAVFLLRRRLVRAAVAGCRMITRDECLELHVALLAGDSGPHPVAEEAVVPLADTDRLSGPFANPFCICLVPALTLYLLCLLHRCQLKSSPFPSRW